MSMRYDAIPSYIYLEPEIAAIGMTEKQAKNKYANVKVGKFPMPANGKSLVEGDTDGVMKVIVDGELGEILGVHLYGKHVTDMIAELSVAMSLEATAEDIIHAIHPHPQSVRPSLKRLWRYTAKPSIACNSSPSGLYPGAVGSGPHVSRCLAGPG